MYRLSLFLEYTWVLLCVRLQGIGAAVRYLRNPNPALSIRVLRRFGAEIGDRCTIKGRVYIDNATEDQNSRGNFSHLHMGENCSIGDGVQFDLANIIRIGDSVSVAGNAAFLTHSDCNRSALLTNIYSRKCAPVIVESNSWIGFNATLMCGVTVGRSSVVAANALVDEDVDNGWLAAGVPAKPVKQILTYETNV